jgi:ankyrin repeat protein
MRLTPIIVLLAASLGCHNSVEPTRGDASGRGSFDRGTPKFHDWPMLPAPGVTEPTTSGTPSITAPPPTTTTGKSTPLIDAIAKGKSPAQIQQIIAAGADVDETGGDKSTPLYYAASRSDDYYERVGRKLHYWPMLPVVQVLIERGANINARCIGGFTPLHGACERGSSDVVTYLVSKGADVKAKDDVGVTPLHVVAGRYDGTDHDDRMAIIRLLVARGAEVNAIDGRGETPRDRAWRTKVSNSAHRLGDNSADVSADALLGELGGTYRKYRLDAERAPTQERGARKP